ncbi:MAG: peptidoglycan DL-endopeptidase RipA [Pseudonocardiales bacterium]|nr:peptidoglycan DL-endopeptidase RipA [Pseudonocardiales bacterium]
MQWKQWGAPRGLSDRRPRGRRVLALAATAATAASLLFSAVPASAMPKPTPPTPPAQQISQGQVDAAASQKAALSQQVGQLSGEIAAAQVQLQQLQAKAELAEQKYTLALTQWRAAQAEARRAERAVVDARQQVADAHVRFVQYVQAIYTGGNLDGTAGSLLTAPDPSALLEHASLESYQQQHKADAIGAMQAASVAKSNADARAQLAEAAAAKAKAKADIQRAAAAAAVVAEQQQKVQLEQDMAGKQADLEQKQQELAQLTYGRARTLTYFAQQHAYEQNLSDWEAWKQHQEHLRWLRNHPPPPTNTGGGNGNSGGGGGGHGSGGPPPTGGSWTPGKGQAAANRAQSQLGLPYAWAGGGAYGPGRGVCVPGDAWNDCNKIGFDCSGLAMYAWGAGSWAHYAASQYSQAGHYHPGAGNLMPGDLIFWSSNGTVWGIHHVAVYIGGGQIVEAPYSGAYVQIASVWEYGGFFGATRPLT